MRIEIDKYGPNVTTASVKLSRKNLDDLLAQALTGRTYPVLMRACEGGVNLTVTVEPNDEHYENRVSGPGSGLVR
jgi:hypothetical protein